MEYIVYFYAAYAIRLVSSFLVGMTFYHRVDKDGMTWKILKYPFYAFAGLFYVMDIVYNYAIAPLFWDMPDRRLETVSERMGRYLLLPDESLRFRFAYFACGVLNKADPNHCERAGKGNIIQ